MQLSHGASGNSSVETDVDANATTIGEALLLDRAKILVLQVIAESGAHSNHIITLQCSLDGTNWEDMSSTLTGTGILDNVVINALFIRFKVTTNEGGASKVTVLMNAK